MASFGTYAFLIGGSLVAVYLVSKQTSADEFDKKSFVAGWVAPGPLTVAAVVGGLIYFSRG